MIRMAKMGALVVVLRGGRAASGNGKGRYIAEWDFGVNPLGRVVQVKRYWDRRAGRFRTSYYGVEPVDPKAGFGAQTFYARELRRPTPDECQAYQALRESNSQWE